MKKFLLFFIILIIFINNYCFGATKEQFYKAINKNYDISLNQDDTVHYHLRQNIVKKTKEFIDTHDISEDTYDKIIDCINEAVNIVRKYGTTDYTKFSKEDIDRLMELVIMSCNYVDVDVYEEFEKEKAKSNEPEIIEVTQKIDPTEYFSGEALSNVLSLSGDIVINSGDNSVVIIQSGDDYYKKELRENTSIIEDIPLINRSNPVKISQEGEFIKALLIAYSIAIVVIIILAFLIRFIQKRNWNKVLKYILIILISIMIILIIGAVILSIVYNKELKYIYEIYYLLGGL